MTGSRSTHLGWVAALRTAVVAFGATGALGAALAIGANTATDSDADGDGEGDHVAARTPSYVSTARPGPQHAQSTGS